MHVKNFQLFVYFPVFIDLHHLEKLRRPQILVLCTSTFWETDDIIEHCVFLPSLVSLISADEVKYELSMLTQNNTTKLHLETAALATYFTW